MIPNKVEDQIITLIGFSEIFVGVVDHVICADRAYQIEIPRTTYAGHLGAERFSYLHRKGPNAARRSVNQDLLPWLNLSLIAKTLQRRDCRHRHRSSLLKCHVSRLQHYSSIRETTYVLSQGSVFAAEHVVAWLEHCDVLTNRFNC